MYYILLHINDSVSVLKLISMYFMYVYEFVYSSKLF